MRARFLLDPLGLGSSSEAWLKNSGCLALVDWRLDY